MSLEGIVFQRKWENQTNIVNVDRNLEDYKYWFYLQFHCHLLVLAVKYAYFKVCKCNDFYTKDTCFVIVIIFKF